MTLSQISLPRGTRRLVLSTAIIALAAGCDSLPDLDLRDRAGGFDTSPAAATLPDRPRADARGVISYPNYQVVVARKDDTINAIAARLGLNPATLAGFNGIAVDQPLREGEVVALSNRVTEPGGTGGLDVNAVATTALDRVDGGVSGGLAPAAGVPAGAEPIRHRVQRGETAFSISRLYNVPVGTIASWNGLSGDLSVREGQFILVPKGSSAAPESQAPLSAPGSGTATPIPPSAAAPLPAESPVAVLAPSATPATPNLGASSASAAPAAPSAPAAAPEPAPASTSSARMILPVTGSIIRDYAPGRNEGIDIGVPAGTTVKAADSGTIAAVTTDTSGTAIVVVRHADNLLTVYTNLEDLSVAKGDSVSRGGTLGKVKAGNPSFVHFEVRRGLQSVDPNDFLP